MTSDKFQKPKEIPALKKTKYDSPVKKICLRKEKPTLFKNRKKVRKIIQVYNEKKKIRT